MLRPMTDPDVAGAVELWGEAFGEMSARYGEARAATSAEADRRLQNRMRHFLHTDPGGSWVADDAGEIVGLSQSFVREGYWVLSLLATAPRTQRRGLGRELLARAMSNADPESPGTIQSSQDPSAMALYESSGFSLHPGLIGRGMVRPGRVGVDPAVRTGHSRDLDLVDAVDRFVRGSARALDIAAMLDEPSNRLLLHGDRGYAIVGDDRLVTLGARDEDAAIALLTTVLAGAGHGTRFQVMWLTSSQQWAIHTLVVAGLELRPHGAVMVRGLSCPPTPYIPSGGYG
jgi:GNAT superfamily N-acetyltransferase